ncbi:hypothetical protein CMO84_08390 [Candidatus Woesearchaeota archaeon]|nr:hypothetical protein [Candidatus Woesearchaeota archaeon]
MWSVPPLALQALTQRNHPERLFLQGGAPVRLEVDQQDIPRLRELSPERTRHELARAARWFVPEHPQGQPAWRRLVLPPSAVVTDVLATPTLPFPPLTRLVEVPVFAPDGTLQTTPGHHPASQTYYQPPTGFVLPVVPDQPTPADLDRARSLLCDDLLGEFPFTSDAEQANAIALLLLPFARDLIDGPTPLHLIEAPTPGSGKGLLADVLTAPAMGHRQGLLAEGRDDDEWRKRLTAVLREGHSVVQIDNVTRPLDSGALAAALTAHWWTDRILGKTETIQVPVRCVWLATGNNPVLSLEIARRTVRIRLDPLVDRPWQRTGFRHPQLRQWATTHRADLVGAALTLIRAWLVDPQPAPQHLGGYERWSEVIGGILACAGITGFLANLSEFYDRADLESAIWRQFVAAWWEQYQSQTVGTADLFDLAVNTEMDLGRGADRSQRTVFGKKLAAHRDRVIGDYRIAFAGTVKRLKHWQLLPTRADVGVHGAHRRTFPPIATRENRGKSPQ